MDRILKNTSLVVCSLLFLLQNCAHKPEAKNVVDDAKASAVIREVVEENVFTTNRGLTEYLNYFGPKFKMDLDNLTQDQHWIDGGAGSANAQKDFLEKLKNEHRPIPFLTAITVKYPDKEPRQMAGGKFQVFADRYFEVIPLSELSAADIITDVVGIINYTESLDVSLDKYLKLLKLSGKIYVFVPDKITRIKKLDGRTLNLKEWISSISGLQTYFLPSEKSPYPMKYSFVIEKLTTNVAIPKLRLRSAEHHVAIFREFEEI
jgi:hypothetical protein